jgi:hypothetical protein
MPLLVLLGQHMDYCQSPLECKQAAPRTPKDDGCFGYVHVVPK